jgi:hypothetical protein
MLLLSRKWRSDAAWNKLTVEQREIVDAWLFDERLSYAEIVARAEKEFGLKSSISSLAMYYRRQATARQGWEMVEARDISETVNALAGPTDQIRQAAVNLAGKAALRTAIEQPEKPEALVALARVLLESEKNGLRRERLKQLDRQFEFQATLAAQEDIPQFRAFLATLESDDRLSYKEKSLRIKEFLFDWNHKEKERERKKQQAREALRHKMAREKQEREEQEMKEREQQAARNPPGKPPQGQTQPKAGTAENSPGNPASQ